ncbi:plasmid pRiA4b ORF-3 family protein, partial [Sphingomonas koreensis]
GDIDERFIRRAVAAIAIRRHNGKLAYQKSRAQ